ncbi:MAG: PEP-CTERM sorting domain-containing protein [Sphingomonas sp.]|nr:PEP-CTERM sorting domain-containing protein [Sphingomonas sp.]
MQGVLVHGTGVEQVNLVVTGNLGAGGPNIVNFSGDTTQTVATSDNLRLQDGLGQADVTGAEITTTPAPNDVYNILSGNIYLTQGGMEWIEFALTGLGNGGTVDIFITLNGTTIVPFLNRVLGNGDTFFAFLANGGDLITNVRYVADNPPGELTTLKQVRIIPGDNVVPEPATWMMMLLGFGAAGYTLRRRRRVLPQLA